MADLSQANLEGSDLWAAQLKDADVEKANLKGTDLKSANLENAELKGANLEGTSLFRANLEGVTLAGVNLKGADIRDANLKGIWLMDVDLKGANLEGTDLENVWFLTSQHLREAESVAGATMPDGIKLKDPVTLSPDRYLLEHFLDGPTLEEWLATNPNCVRMWVRTQDEEE